MANTLQALLQKIYSPSAGAVMVDGLAIETRDTDSLRSQIACVAQEPRLFNTTVARNIQSVIPVIPVTPGLYGLYGIGV